jgi:hypothetical protein
MADRGMPLTAFPLLTSLSAGRIVTPATAGRIARGAGPIATATLCTSAPAVVSTTFAATTTAFSKPLSHDHNVSFHFDYYFRNALIQGIS